MGKTTGIEWTDSTWNPIRGCSRVSEGCRNCYAESVAARFSGKGQAYEGLATFKVIDAGKPGEHLEPRWTGDIRFIEKALRLPLSWKEPRKIFVNSMSDLFHPSVTAEMLGEIFHVMARAPQHTYQILTKRPERMFEALEAGSHPDVADSFSKTYGLAWPPPNWWFGVSIEDQETANHRLQILARCKAAVRFVSYEPALGPVDLAKALGSEAAIAALDWIIVGGESGPRARPLHPDWVRAIRDTTAGFGTPFFFKQWGAWQPGREIKGGEDSKERSCALHADGTIETCDCCSWTYEDATPEDPAIEVTHVGKHKAGALLDGIEWKEFPNVERVAVA